MLITDFRMMQTMNVCGNVEIKNLFMIVKSTDVAVSNKPAMPVAVCISKLLVR
jgi:hypothetical protein